MKTRVTIECKTCDSEISQFSEPDVIALAKASGWTKVKGCMLDKWKCASCIQADAAEAEEQETLAEATT